MKVFLMHRNRDFSPGKMPSNEGDLVKDLELETLVGAMAEGDEFLSDVSHKALFSGIGNDKETVLYRQAVLKDCLKNPSAVRQIYGLTVETIDKEKAGGFFLPSSHPSGILYDSIRSMEIFVSALKRLRTVAETHAGRFQSAGFKTLFGALERECNGRYLAQIEGHLDELKFPGGVLVGAELGETNEGTRYTLRRPPRGKTGLLHWIWPSEPGDFTLRIDGHDDVGAKTLSEIQDRGINLAANALAQSAEHVLGFFTALRTELAFYIGCLNLSDSLSRLRQPVSIPLPKAIGERELRFRGLYDPCLALTMERGMTGNALDGNGKSFFVITGANQGGKSTFLRAIGLAQIMTQAGMFVAADALSTSLCAGLFTHFKREEDEAMESGKLDEELKRMSDIADAISPGSIILLNESFASTNEREGSEIARQVVMALLEKGVRVFFVTHLYDLAHGLFKRKVKNAVYLRAERRSDGKRTYKLKEGEPLETSYGKDLYTEVFGAS